MNLNVQNTMKWSQNITPNTLIGGIAKTGGTGVNAPIDTPYKLAQKLLINVNRITGFKIIFDDVSCRIRGTYTLPPRVFGTDTVGQVNENITYYHDIDNLCTYVDRGSFSKLPNLKRLTLNGLLNSGIDWVINNPELEELYINSCITLSKDVNAGVGYGCPKLHTFSANSATSYNGYYLLKGTKVPEVILPNIVSFRDSTTGNVIINEAFMNMTMVTLIDLRKLESFQRVSGVDAHADKAFRIFQGIKTGCVIKVRDVLATLNAGSPPPDLLYAKNSRGAIIELYDSSGNYVSTL